MADPLNFGNDLKIRTGAEIAADRVDDEIEELTVEDLALEFSKAAIASGAYNTEAGVNFEAAIVQAWTNGLIAWRNGQETAAKLFNMGSTQTDFTP